MFSNKAFYRKLDGLLGSLSETRRPHHALALVVDQIVTSFRDDLGTVSGRLYQREGGQYYLRHSSAPMPEGLESFTIPAGYAPIRTILEEGTVAIHEDFHGYDRELESRLGVQNYAAFSLSDGEFLIAFAMDSEAEEEAILFALGVIRHSLALHLRQASILEEIDEAEAIQLSLLPEHPPRFEGFDIAASTFAAEATEVGGDIHDFLDLGPESLGIAVGDASGHGLPAALQARDVITGLRMGVEKEMKITAVIRRLNDVVHASRLATRFVSLFYGELERSGNLIYVNAGHNEPIIIGPGDEIERLSTGGIILGPAKGSVYGRGFTRLNPGRQMLIFTDGLVERHFGERSAMDEFGEERLLAVFRDCYELSARATVERIIAEARAYGGESPWEDDVTLLVVKPS